MVFLRRSLHFIKSSSPKKEYSARKLVGFSVDQMYTVVADVKNYKKFVPFCTKSTVLSKEIHRIHANLEVGFPPIYENYTSTVSFIKPKSVHAICKDGRLFTTLETKWNFSPGLKSNAQSCIVDFYINFEFKSVLYSQIASLFFEQLVEQMEEAFISEARRRYGEDSIPTHRLHSV